MLAPSRSLLNREYIPMYIQKASSSIVSIYNLHIIFVSKIAPRHFTLFTNEMFRPFNQRKKRIGRSISMREVDRTSLILIDFNIQLSHQASIEFSPHRSFLKT
jgi:hypothetical protein